MQGSPLLLKRIQKKIDGDVEAHLIAMSCSEPPEGYARWSLRLLADKSVELGYIDSISHESVRGVLKKNEIKPWKKEGWVIPPEHNGSFVANMEKVLEVYKRPIDPKNPVVCMDESPKKLIAETRFLFLLRLGNRKSMIWSEPRLVYSQLRNFTI